MTRCQYSTWLIESLYHKLVNIMARLLFCIVVCQYAKQLSKRCDCLALTISSSAQTIALTRIPPFPNTTSLRSLQLRISRPKPTPSIKLIAALR
jgi:hypothetical protein